MLQKYGYFVSPESATNHARETFGINRAHADLVAFESRDSEDYCDGVLPKLKDFVAKAGKQVQNRISRMQQRFFEVPIERSPSFFGRQGVLQLIDQTLSKPRTSRSLLPQVVVLEAMGGQGKTQVALQYCLRKRFEYAGIFWIDASSQKSIRRRFESIASKVGHIGEADSTNEPGMSKIEVVLTFLASWEQRWLLVFDNFDRPDLVNLANVLPECMYSAPLGLRIHS